MEQLTIKDIFNLVKQLQKSGMSIKEIASMPIYIGDDDELNGVHTAWYVNTVDPNNEDDADLVEFIEDNYGNRPLEGKSILIS